MKCGREPAAVSLCSLESWGAPGTPLPSELPLLCSMDVPAVVCPWNMDLLLARVGAGANLGAPAFVLL